ncbi:MULTISPECIES: (2Fe-2S)-binding protein [Photobacterium]|jgi:carbon-monoxide dehydrogenase small subunit|uniref:(2Fe-2S)-binding protein n=1 Tax=Photobacterium alginatilyticum TaxID=1775171 RepID=A0ABW9YFV4_9GAMM|nr:(2Fe-2S)-binding protein [Photobacterium alginatilyticum]NBI52595.1 (2Fe-2S)-binding protein [Photobacterium alginatilyticum]
MKIEFYLNDELVEVEADPMQSLLNTLRGNLNKTATKEGCGEGECGACSILFNGKLVNACMMPIAQAEGARLMTLEGLRQTEKGQCVIDALLEAKGVQCGFCTPGMVLALYALLEVNAKPSEQEIRTAISGNLCRCTGYGMIVDAARIASEKGEGLW